MSFYRSTTRGIQITATPTFEAEYSDVAGHDYRWSYKIEIENTSPETVQLTARRWQITDGNGVTQIVQGAGVVGEQPILHEGDSFTYSSHCPLSTPSGLMRGTYRMVSLEGEVFEAEIPAFSLDSPHDVRVIN